MGPGSNVIKHFASVIYKCVQNRLECLSPSPKIVGKARSLRWSGPLEKCFARVGSIFIYQHFNRLEVPVSNTMKH